ncbi:hypothetical protein [Parvularcula maris]|uniref:Uncharacterized protein n=1 Tax=Parvularcula maris TaxID=2965077 RepID=A0A9X2RIK7_9PROT|nr:hypothetical protein [Parvularcula maris]MCQ8185086.1 hypothetical protein [Parvularcula maris]
MKLTVRRLPLLAALGFAVTTSLILLTRTSAMEAGLFLPIFVLFLLLVLYAIAYHLRKPVLIALDAEGKGAIPKLPHLLARQDPRRFEAHGTTIAYEDYYLIFDPALRTTSGERIEKLYLNPKQVSGGLARIEAFTRFARQFAPTPTLAPEETTYEP